MSGSTQVVVTPSGQSFGTSNGGQPKASRVYPFSLNLIAGTQSIVDLRTQQNLKNVQDIQGIYIDNSANATACQVSTPSGQIITCPPNGQGQSPAYVSPLNPTFTFVGSGTVNIVLNNFPTPANFWSTNGASFPMSGGKVLVTDPILDVLATNDGLKVVDKPQSLTLVPLDASTVVTGGTAVTALIAGNRTAGGWIHNPASATTNLGINEIGTASGTTSSGNTTFISPGQTYQLAPSGNAVSVISSDNAHVFSGYGFQ